MPKGWLRYFGRSDVAEQFSCPVDFQHRRLAFVADRVGANRSLDWVHFENLASHKPIERVVQYRQALLELRRENYPWMCLTMVATRRAHQSLSATPK